MEPAAHARNDLEWHINYNDSLRTKPISHDYTNNTTPDIAQIIQHYDQQGIHRTGTEVDNASAEWLAKQIENLGIKTEQQSFSFERVIPRTCHVVINGEPAITATPLYDCHYTPAEGVSGKLEQLRSVEFHSHALPNSRNSQTPKIGIVLAPPSENTPEQQQVIEARQSHRYSAIVVVTPDNMPINGAALVNAEHFSAPFGPPVIQVAHEHWARLVQAESASTTITVVATVDRVISKAVNVCATIPATATTVSTANSAPIVVMTPRSGWWQCASERGGGLAAFLLIMARLKQSPLTRDVIFTANTGHELGHIGLDDFLRRNPKLTERAHCWIHLGANFAARGGTVIVQHSDAELEKLANSQLALHHLTPDLTIGQGRRPFGEARNVYDGGGRYLSLLGSNALFHHPQDRWPTAVDMDKTHQWSNWIADCVVQLAQQNELT